MISPLERSLLGFVLQTYEAHVLDLIVCYAKQNGWVVGSLQFDGLYIEHRDGSSLDEFIQGAQAEVAKATQTSTLRGLEIQLKEKKLHDSNRSNVILDNWERCLANTMCDPLEWVS